MAVIRIHLLLLLLYPVGHHAPKAPTLSQEMGKIKDRILSTGENKIKVDDVIGIGGSYGFLLATCSKAINGKRVIESDHWPPKDVYQYAKDKHIADLSDNHKAALSMTFEEHLGQKSTGTVAYKGNQKYKEDVGYNKAVEVGFMQHLMKEGRYYELVENMVDLYKHDLKEAFEKFKPGIIQGLDVHVKNQLITEEQKHEIISKFKLDEPTESFEMTETRRHILNLGERYMDEKFPHLKMKNSKKQKENIPTDSGVSTVSCSTSRRTRREAGKTCVFHLADSNDNSGHKNEIEEIDSKAFLEEYSKSTPDLRNELSSLAESSRGIISGDDSDVGKVSKIIDHEKLKKLETTTSSIKESLDTGDFDIDRIPENTRISPTKTRSALKTKLAKYAKKGEKVSNPLGKFLLAKSVVQGIKDGDMKGLAIMSGRIGGEAGLELLGKYGTKYAAKVASKAGMKYFSFLSKAANPIGSVVDIGLSIGRLTDAVSRLRNPNANRYEQNEAIAEIVGESLDIAITAVTTIASLIAPPLAPVFAVIGFFTSLFVTAAVAVYNAQNHVNYLNSKLPLLDYEKKIEFGRHFFDIAFQGTSEYIDNLIKTKDANNLVVNVSIGNLEENSDLIGHVFPSRQIKLIGGCRQEVMHCATINGGCWRWPVHYETLAWNCFRGGKCLDVNRTCVDGYRRMCGGFRESFLLRRLAPDSHVYCDFYKCECDREEGANSDPEIDSWIDFRQMESTLYLNRAAPDSPIHSSYEYICRPSSLISKGDRISVRDKTSGYRCDGAIGIHKMSKNGQYMLYDLEEGMDHVYLSSEDLTNNRHLVGDGNKQYFGGGGSDIYVIKGPCSNLSGTLDGGRGHNGLVVLEKCNPGKTLDINLNKSKFDFQLELLNLEQIYGRIGECDIITASCNTKYIAGGGGRRNEPDVINLPLNGGCEATVQIVAKGSTIINGGCHSFTVQIEVMEEHLNFTANYKLSSTKKQIFLLKMSPKSLNSYSFSGLQESGFYDVTLNFGEGKNIRLKFTSNHSDSSPFIQNQEIVFVGGVTNTGLLIGKDGSLLALHDVQHLENNGSHVIIEGAQGCPNHFNVYSGNWTIIGGRYNDVFNIKHSFTGQLIGNGGQGNTLSLDDNLSGKVSVDFVSETITSFGSVTFSNITRLSGRTGQGDNVSVGCSSKFINGEGGSLMDRDYVVVLETTECPQISGYNTTIFIPSHTTVDNGARSGQFEYIVMSEDNFTINTNPGAEHEFRFQGLGLGRLLSANYGTNRILTVQLVTGKALKFDIHSVNNPKLHFMEDETRTDLHVLVGQAVQATILINSPPQDGATTYEGIVGAQNEFIINFEKHDEANIGQIIGAELDDSFRLQGANYIQNINGGEGRNSLKIETSFWPSESLIIDNRQNGSIISSTNKTLVANVTNIQIIQGRCDASNDTVTIDCGTTFVSCFNRVIVTNCLTQQTVSIEVALDTEVKFVRTNRFDDFDVFPNSSFHYNLLALRSFSVEMDLWMDTHQTLQIYHLPLDVASLQKIVFQDFEVIYEINGTSYSHSVHPHLSSEDQFYSRPKLLTKDGFQIQISRQGEIQLSSSRQDLLFMNEDVSLYANMAAKLSVSILLDGSDVFLYAGYKNTTNVLTNTEKHSILFGGGSNSTEYKILNLIENVQIIPGFGENDTSTIHMVDLTEIMYTIRQHESSSKYVPQVTREENDLILSMDDYKSTFPGKVILVNGTQYLNKIHVLLDAVVMTIKSLQRDKRDVETKQRYWLHPFPLIISPSEITVMSLQDFELGQEILIQGENGTSLIYNSSQFKSYRNGDDLVVSNVEGIANFGTLSSFTLLEAFTDVKPGLAESVVMEIEGNGTTLWEELDALRISGEEKVSLDWEQVLEKKEDELLKELPEVERKFQVPLSRRIWKNYYYWSLAVLPILLLVFFVCIVFCSWSLVSRWKYTLVVTEKKRRGNVVKRQSKM